MIVLSRNGIAHVARVIYHISMPRSGFLEKDLIEMNGNVHCTVAVALAVAFTKSVIEINSSSAV